MRGSLRKRSAVKQVLSKLKKLLDWIEKVCKMRGSLNEVM